MKPSRILAALPLALALALTGALPAVSAEDAALTITGDGVEREASFSLTELKGMSGSISRDAYSAWNTWPTRKTHYAEGVVLSDLLELAGVKEGATTVNIAESPAADGSAGFNVTFLLEDLFAERHTYEDGKKAVPAIIAFKESEKGLSTLEETDLRLIYGQLDPQEQTTAGFVKAVRVITVTTAPARKLTAPLWTAVPLQDGRYSVTLASDNPGAKVYYTTDGSTPTVHDKMYNISAPGWQPQLNAPFEADGDALICAIAVASGFADSDVLRFTPSSGFGDVPATHWAYPAVSALAEEGIISGMGNGVFAPEGSLTRAQFAKMMTLAVTGEEPPPASLSSFSDVRPTDWFAPYVSECVNLGLFAGYEDGSFRPDEPVTKEQMLAIAVRALPDGESDDVSDSQAFTSGISGWARGYVEQALEKGLIADEMTTGQEGALSLKGTEGGTRAEAAHVVFSLLPLL